MTRWTDDTKSWIKSRLSLKSSKRLPALMLFPRNGDPVLYDDGWDFTSLMKFVRQVAQLLTAHMSSTATGSTDTGSTDTGSTIKHSIGNTALTT